MLTTSSRPTIGVALLALLALLEISWGIQVALGAVDSAEAPPAPVMGLFALIGVPSAAVLLVLAVQGGMPHAVSMRWSGRSCGPAPGTPSRGCLPWPWSWAPGPGSPAPSPALWW